MAVAHKVETTGPEDHLDPTKPYPLDGITVVDFTRVLAGPTCTRMLADGGARIIKIDTADKKIGLSTRDVAPLTDEEREQVSPAAKEEEQPAETPQE